jgi:uncharacterized protein YodC (DUF2158 family)
MADAKVEKKALAVGDVVTLNSGGSSMTVIRLMPKGATPDGVSVEGAHVTCTWEGKDGVIHAADFPAEALKSDAKAEAKPETKPAAPGAPAK